jgi:hypothetical protein
VTEAHKRCYIKYPLAYKRLRKAIEHKNWHYNFIKHIIFVLY